MSRGFKAPFPIGYQFHTDKGIATVVEFLPFDWDYKIELKNRPKDKYKISITNENNYANHWYMCHAEIVGCKPYKNWGLLFKAD